MSTKLQPSLHPSLYVDMFGNPIREGDYIVYSAVDGRSATMRAGQVIALTAAKQTEWSHTKGETPEPKVFVRSWSNFNARDWNGKERSGRQKNVTLSFLDRLIVVPASIVSNKIKDDLEKDIPESRWA